MGKYGTCHFPAQIKPKYLTLGNNEIEDPNQRLSAAELEVMEGILRGLVEANLIRNQKRNYNLDHLARMNFRRSFRAGHLNTRHILGSL